MAAGSAINFPRPAVPATGGIVINNIGVTQADNTEFLLPAQGVYRVSWLISVTATAQFSLWIGLLAGQAAGGQFQPITVNNGVPSQSGQATGTEQFFGDTIFATPFVNAVIQVRNYASSAAVTVTPVPGGTQAQSVVLNIMRLA